MSAPAWGERRRTGQAAQVLEQPTGQTPLSKARYTIRSSGIRRNEKLAVHCQSVGLRQGKPQRKV